MIADYIAEPGRLSAVTVDTRRSRIRDAVGDVSPVRRGPRPYTQLSESEVAAIIAAYQQLPHTPVAIIAARFDTTRMAVYAALWAQDVPRHR
jgi:hypothetical protein